MSDRHFTVEELLPADQQERCEAADADAARVRAQVARELCRIANTWGTQSKGWTCKFEPGGFVLSAYVWKPSCIVASVSHRSIREGLRELLSSLVACDAS